MKRFILSQDDIDALLTAIDRDPQHGDRGGSSCCLSEAERATFDEAHRFFNYQVRTWVQRVTA